MTDRKVLNQFIPINLSTGIAMDEITEIYEKIKDRMSMEDFLARMEEKKELLGGLPDDKTLATLVIYDMGEYDDKIKIGQVTLDNSNVTIVGKITVCSDAREFNREDGSTGSVANLTVADETGSIRVVLWESAADLVQVGEIVFGDAVQVSGFVREGRNGLEVSVGRGGSVDKVAMSEEIRVRTEPYRIEEIKAGMSDIHLVGKILDMADTRTFQRKDNSTGKVRNLTLGDPTGKIRLTLWDENVEHVDQLNLGDTIEITGGYSKENSFNNQVEINLGNNSSIKKTSKQVEFSEKITLIGDIEINESYSIIGYVTGLDELREFQRKDGSSGRVVNIHLSDDSGRIKTALWDKQTGIIHEIDIGTKLQLTDCYAKSGWNDEVELSVGERSTITILEK